MVQLIVAYCGDFLSPIWISSPSMKFNWQDENQGHTNILSADVTVTSCNSLANYSNSISCTYINRYIVILLLSREDETVSYCAMTKCCWSKQILKWIITFYKFKQCFTQTWQNLYADHEFVYICLITAVYYKKKRKPILNSDSCLLLVSHWRCY